MGIATVIFAITSIILSSLIPKANLNSFTEVLKAEIRQQQLAAMSGEKDVSDSAVNYGVLFSEDQYTLFAGTTYDPVPVDSYTTQAPEALGISTDFANNAVIFEKGSGEVQNFDSDNRTITITDSLSKQSKTITLNKYGIPE